MTPPFLPYGRQDIDEDDIAAVVSTLRGDFLTTGPMVEQFETALAAQVGARHAVACSNGTTALHLATLAAGLGPGTVGIVPAVTFAATAAAVLHTGAEVVFSDVDPNTALMTPALLDDAITRARSSFPNAAPACILPVHMAGRAADMAGLADIAHAHGMTMIEDAAHALGTAGPDGTVGDGRHSLATTFSFHPVKTITSGEGGAVTTNDDARAARMRRLRNHGMTREPDDFTDCAAGFEGDMPHPWYYEIAEPGFNYRISDLQCALGFSQLSRLDAFIARRKALHEGYRARFAGLDGIAVPDETAGARTAWHLGVVLIDFPAFGISRADVMRGLADAGIGTQVHYMPLYRHPLYRHRYGEQRLSGAEGYYARALSLPLFPRMTDDDVSRVADTLLTVLGIRA